MSEPEASPDIVVLEEVDTFCTTDGCENNVLSLVEQGLAPCIRIPHVPGSRVVCGACGNEILDVRVVTQEEE